MDNDKERNVDLGYWTSLKKCLVAYVENQKVSKALLEVQKAVLEPKRSL